DEGRAVPIVWGTVRLNGPNIGWFGDLRTKAIKKKVKTGLFSSKNVIVGYRYFLGIDFMLCRGDMTTGTPDLSNGIRKIWVQDELLRSGGSWVNDGTISFDQPQFFGGKDEGGIVGTMRVYPGSTGQVKSSYMANLGEIVSTKLPAYRGTAHVVLEGMEVGNSANIPPWSFEVRRVPNGLNLTLANALVSGHGANPANVIYEIMTNAEWGLGISNIDEAQFSTAAAVLATEGNSYGRIMDRPVQAKQILSEIQQQIDGFIVQNPISKQWQLKLVRETDYPSPLTDVPLFNASNIKPDGLEFTRGSWADTTNQVKVQFTDRNKEFKTTFAIAQDMANRIIQNGDNVTTTLNMPGIQDRTVANKYAWRELRTLSYPLAKGKIIANREHLSLLPGDLARITWEPFGLENFFVRIGRIQLGSDDGNEIVFDWTEDIFRQEVPSFSDPDDTLWIATDQGAVNAAAVRVLSLPLGFSESNTEQQYGVMVSRGNGLQATYDLYYKEGIGSVLSPRTDTIALAEDVSPFTPTALLSGAIEVNESSPNNLTNQTITIDTGNDIDELDTNAVVTDLDVDFAVGTPPNLILVDDEIMFYESITDLGGGSFTLNNVHRGMLDTAVAPHDDNSIVWFMSEGMAQISIPFAASTTVFALWVMSNAGGGSQGTPDSSPTGSPEKGVLTLHDISKRFEGPSAPVNVSIDGVRLGDVTTLGDTFNINWRNRVNSFTVRSKDQEDINDGAISGVDYTVRVYHTGVSPEVLVYNQTGIAANAGISPLGGTHAVSGYAVDFSPITSPWVSPQPFAQTYRVEIEAETTGSPTVTSQKWSRDFTRA
ncbi:MAG: phage tail protein, partial [Planctomycetota bacterium]